MKSVDRFRAEILDLEDLHLATIYAYNETVDRLRERTASGALNEEEPILSRLQGFSEPIEIARTPKRLRTALRTEYQQHIREIIFVRAISTLEVFLISTIRELFVVRPDLFTRSGNIEIPYDRVLTFKSISALSTYIVNRDVRGLQSAGFSKISRYYKRHFAVDFDGFDPGLRRLQELHDRRHLLVHRLGRTDAKYRHDYRVKARRVEVGRTYLAEAFSTLRAFIEYIETRTQRLALKRVDRFRLAHAPTGVARVAVRPITRRGKEVLRIGYMFEHDEELVSLQDLLAERSHDHDTKVHVLLLQGDFFQVRNYIGELERLAALGSLEILNIEFKPQGKYGKRGLPLDFIAAVAAALPSDSTVPDGLKREIAEKHAKPISMVSETISDVQLGRKVGAWLEGREWYQGIHSEVAEVFGLEEPVAYRTLKRIRKGVYWPTTDSEA